MERIHGEDEPEIWDILNKGRQIREHEKLSLLINVYGALNVCQALF